MARKLSDVGNDGNPNKVGDFNQAVRMGSAIKLGGQSVVAAVSSNVLTLAEAAKAAHLLSVYVRAGGVTGAFTVVSGTPATGQASIDNLGNVQFLPADAVTEAEVVYIPAEGNIIEKLAFVSGGVAAIGDSRARILLEAEQLTGAAANTKTVVARAAAPAAGQAAVGLTGTVVFNAEANGEQVRVKYVEFPAVSTVQRLEETVAY